MARWIKNNTGGDKVYNGQTISAGAYYEIPDEEHIKWSSNSVLLVDISNNIAIVSKDDSGSTDITDFNKAINHLKGNTVHIDAEDAETGGIKYTPKFSPDGWKQQRFETEFETSVSGSVHEKDPDNNDIGWSSLKFYKVVGGVEVECSDQSDRDINCIRTDLEWMPNTDYMIKGGFVSQFDDLNEDIYSWVQGGVIDAVYGIDPTTFAEGGINMRYVSAKTPTGLDGVAGTIMYYSHELLGDGKGTNKLRFIFRHAAGKKHRFQCIMDIFRA